MPVPLLAARDVTKSYGRGAARFDALKGVSLEIFEGESVAIIGKSGSGKSTLMHLLALLDRPTAGAVELSGRMRCCSTDRIAALRVTALVAPPD